MLATPAQSVTFVVNTHIDRHDSDLGDGQCIAVDDDGRTLLGCSLRAAIEESNALRGSDHIAVAPGMYFLMKGELRIHDSTTILGTGDDPGETILDDRGASRVLTVSGPEEREFRPYLQLRNLTVQNGSEDFTPGGAGLYIARDSSAGISDVVFRKNRARFIGGAITVGGSLWMSRSVLEENGSTSRGCDGVDGGGGLYVFPSGRAVIDGSLIAANEHTRGGGIRNAGVLRIANSTISNNKAGCEGAGVLNHGEADATLAFTTITENALERSSDYAPNSAGIYNQGKLTLGNSVVAGNLEPRDRNRPNGPLPPLPSDCKNDATTAEFVTAGYNVIGNFDDCRAMSSELRPGARATDAVGPVGPMDDPLDARLGPLAASGDAKRTHALLEGSPAINRGHDPDDPGSFDVGDRFFACRARDQRRLLRPGFGSKLCDAGAYELRALIDVGVPFYLDPLARLYTWGVLTPQLRLVPRG